MRAVARQFGAAVAFGALFFQLLDGASIEHALVVAAVTGGATLFALTTVGSVATYAGRSAPRPAAAAVPDSASAPEAGSDSDTDSDT